MYFLTIHEKYLFLTGNNDFFFKLITVMDSSLPTSLKHIISNVEYYGPVLFMAGMMLFCSIPSLLIVLWFTAKASTLWFSLEINNA